MWFSLPLLSGRVSLPDIRGGEDLEKWLNVEFLQRHGYDHVHALVGLSSAFGRWRGAGKEAAARALKAFMQDWAKLGKHAEIRGDSDIEESAVTRAKEAGQAVCRMLCEELGKGEAAAGEIKGCGVSMMDAAMILNDGNDRLALHSVGRWQKNRKHKELLKFVGYDAKHSQRKLFTPPSLVTFLEKVEPAQGTDSRRLLTTLGRMARQPIPSATVRNRSLFSTRGKLLSESF